jgi:hypothetical protein
MSFHELVFSVPLGSICVGISCPIKQMFASQEVCWMKSVTRGAGCCCDSSYAVKWFMRSEVHMAVKMSLLVFCVVMVL